MLTQVTSLWLNHEKVRVGRGVAPDLISSCGCIKNSCLFSLHYLRNKPLLLVPLLLFEGVTTRSMVDALSESCSPFLKGGDLALIAEIASGLFQNANISHSNNDGPTGTNRNKIGSNYQNLVT